MEITLKKLVKCVTQNGRRALVRELLEQELTKDALVSGACKAVTKGINDGINKIEDKSKLGTVHTGLTCLHNSVGAVLVATDPTSEEGVKISERETNKIVGDVGTSVCAIVDDEAVGKLREYIVAKVP